MKHSHLLKLRSAAATLCAAVLLCACSQEVVTDGDQGGGEDGDLTTVTLSVGTAANEQTILSKALSPDQENAIKTLYALALQPDRDGEYRLKYNATGQPATGGTFKFSLRLSMSGGPDTKLLLIANLNPFSQVNKGMTYDEVQKALTSATLTAAPKFAGTGIPMSGFVGNSADTPLEITKNMTPLASNLLRTVARVDVGVGTYNDANGTWSKKNNEGQDVNFDMKEVYVFNSEDKYTLLPATGKLIYDNNGTPSVNGPSPAEAAGSVKFEYTDAITDNTYCKAEIYIPEVDFNGGIVFDENHKNRTALVIGGTYKDKKNYYRIDFTTTQTNVAGTQLNNVLRNHIYRYSITNVSSPGYDTPENAYSSQPVMLSFTAGVTDWTTGTTSSPAPDMLVRMNFGGINGTIVQGPRGTVKKKTDYFTTDTGRPTTELDYNSLRGEAQDNTYTGLPNGGLYTSVQNAFDREGPYARLVIAPDNVGAAVVWKTGSNKEDRVLVAKKACWDYRGQGRSDWRLPRLSELYLIWLNRVTINQSKGFTSLGATDVAYWSGSEGGNQDQAYTVNAAGEITLQSKSSPFLVRCVREVQ